MTAHLNGKVHKPEIDFDDKSPSPGPALWVKRLKGDEQIICVVLGDHVHGVWSHWVPSGKGKSAPHFKDSSTCPGCIARQAKRWKGYLHVFDFNTNKEIFLELTPHSARQLEITLGRKTEYRGERIRVARSKGDNGRLTVALLARVQHPEALPAEKDPRPTILELWGVEEDDPQGWLSDDEKEDRFNL